MSVTLRQAKREDVTTIWKMQTEAFADLLKKYKDYDTNPGAEKEEKVLARFEKEETKYFFIEAEGRDVGVIRVVEPKDGSRKRISPLFIMKEYRNNGYAQEALKAAEDIYGSSNWSLGTILQEEGNIHLYEKMGYRRNGVIINVNDKMDIVIFDKD